MAIISAVPDAARILPTERLRVIGSDAASSLCDAAATAQIVALAISARGCDCSGNDSGQQLL